MCDGDLVRFRMTASELLKKLELDRDCAFYNIFAQQCLQAYFRGKISKDDLPFSLPGVDQLDGTTLSLDQFIWNMNK